MYMGIEIGGTKLQLGVGDGESSEFAALERAAVDPAHGAAGILEQIERAALPLVSRFPIERIGIGFGGPINQATGVVTTSHQIDGWDSFPLSAWIEKTLGRPARIINDCDAAALAEATLGAARGSRSMFYLTVGTGIGGGHVVEGRLQGIGRPAIAEIGHLRPGPHADRPEETVESLASGWGIVAAAVHRITGEVTPPFKSVRGGQTLPTPLALRQRIADREQADIEFAADLRSRCGDDLGRLTTQHVAQAAAEGNSIAADVLDHALATLGWAVAQVITLNAPEMIVVGGGVSLMGEQQFFAPLRRQVARYVFPPLDGSYKIVPASLGESVVVHGALRWAATS